MKDDWIGGMHQYWDQLLYVCAGNCLTYCWVSCDVVYLSGGKPSIETHSSECFSFNFNCKIKRVKHKHVIAIGWQNCAPHMLNVHGMCWPCVNSEYVQLRFFCLFLYSLIVSTFGIDEQFNTKNPPAGLYRTLSFVIVNLTVLEWCLNYQIHLKQFYFIPEEYWLKFGYDYTSWWQNLVLLNLVQ